MLLPTVAALLGLAVVVAALLSDDVPPTAAPPPAGASRRVVLAAPDELTLPQFPVRVRGYARADVDAYVTALQSAYADLWKAASGAPEAAGAAPAHLDEEGPA